MLVNALVIAIAPDALGHFVVILRAHNFSDQARNTSIVKAACHLPNVTGKEVLRKLYGRTRLCIRTQCTREIDKFDMKPQFRDQP